MSYRLMVVNPHPKLNHSKLTIPMATDPTSVLEGSQDRVSEKSQVGSLPISV